MMKLLQDIIIIATTGELNGDVADPIVCGADE